MTIRRKLKDRKGFTLAETLMAVLILLLVSVIVATGVPVAKTAYEKVVLTANAQTLMSTVVNALRDELGTAWDVRIDDTYGKKNGTFLTYYSADTGARSKISLGVPDGGGPSAILLQENIAVSGLGVGANAASTPRLLASDKQGVASLSYLYAEYGAVQYDAAQNEVTFTNLTVSTGSGSGKHTLVTLDSLTIKAFSNK